MDIDLPELVSPVEAALCNYYRRSMALDTGCRFRSSLYVFLIFYRRWSLYNTVLTLGFLRLLCVFRSYSAYNELLCLRLICRHSFYLN